MTDPLDIQAGIPVAMGLVALLIYSFKLLIKVSVGTMRTKLLRQVLTVPNTSVTLKQICDADDKRLLTLYYRSLPLASLSIVVLLVVSLATTGYGLLTLVMSLQGDQMPKAEFLKILFAAFGAVLFGAPAILIIEGTSLRISELQ